MCTTCGDGENEHVLVGRAEQRAPRVRPHGPPALRGARGWVREVRTMKLQRDLLAHNNQTASRTRRLLSELDVTMFNLVGAPGSGKTALLEATIRWFRSEGSPTATVSVLASDPSTAQDARRIEQAGGRAIQINTGAGCHLDASMIRDALGGLTPVCPEEEAEEGRQGSLVFIENVGTLVCPALYDLGERAKVVVMSVTEGEDQPLKYAHVFRAAELFLLTKTDLLPHVSATFDLRRCLANARRVNPRLQCIPIATPMAEGLDDWCGWVKDRMQGRDGKGRSA